MKRQLARALLFAIAAWTSGCATFNLNLTSFNRVPRKSAEQVAELICLWQAAEGVGMDELPTRGFAGQLLFFVSGNPEPVRIDGDVRIFVFDDQGTAEEQSRPLHEFHFPAAVWDAFLYNTNLGPAYQLFVPYTRKGGQLANCSLRVQLTAENRMPVYSKMANVTLPGRRVKSENESANAPLAAAAAELEPQQSIAEMAAIQKASAELGTGSRTGNRTAQLDRLKSAARNAVRTADYEVETVGEDDPSETAADVAEPPVSSRRYRMSLGEKPE